MDPLSQAVLGAALPQSVSRSQDVKDAFILGALAGMAPDLDVLIRSSEDPQLFLEFHRQFTHSLMFIPVGGFLCALIYWLVKRRQVSFFKMFVIATLGWGTHGLLDACTSYGTQLFWPWTNQRVAWNNVGIIDLVPTLSLLLAVVWSWRVKSATPARIGLTIFLGYLLLGVMQRDRALVHQAELIKSRNHTAERVTVKPTISNLILWRSIYEHQERFYVDAIRVPFFGDAKVYEGESILKLNRERDFPFLLKDSRQSQDIGRFEWFSDSYVGISPDRPQMIGDIRFALLPNEIAPLWGIEVLPDRHDQHTPYLTFREVTAERRALFWDMLVGR